MPGLPYTSSHGSEAARKEMKEIIARERAEERDVAVVCQAPDPKGKRTRPKRVLLVTNWDNTYVTRPVTTRSGSNNGANIRYHRSQKAPRFHTKSRRTAVLPDKRQSHGGRSRSDHE